MPILNFSKLLNIYQRYLLPGIIFQSVVIAGGYTTGRELVEFFLKIGPKSGLAAMVISALVWAIVCAASFELARTYQAYNYRDFFRKLLGSYWWLFEVSYLALVLIMLSIVAASAGSTFQELFHIPYNVGVVIIFGYTALMVFYGNRWIAFMLSFWSIVLYIIFAIFFGYSWFNWSPTIINTFSQSELKDGIFIAGLTYAAYNLGLVPTVLFATKYIKTSKDAIVSGIFAGLLAMIPGVLLFGIMFAHYPDILNATVPSAYLLSALNQPWLTWAFMLVMFGTLLETAIGIIHSVNDRIANWLQEQGKDLPSYFRPVTSFTLLGLSFILSQFGLINLIVKGYGTLTWIMIAVYIVPILVWGVWQIVARRRGLVRA